MREQLRLGVWLVLAFGLVLTLASLFADPLALGQPGSSFGWKQVSGTLIGALVVAGAGLALHRLGRDHGGGEDGSS